MSTHHLFETNKDLFLMFVLDFVNPTHSTALTEQIQSFLVNTSDLNTFGIIYLFIVFTMFFQNFAYFVNKIHNTKKRGFIPTILLYLSFIFIIPSSLVIFTYIAAFLPNSTYKLFLGFAFGLLFITLIFIISVNSKIVFKAAFTSALITIIILKFTQFMFSYYIMYNQAIHTIYGIFSVIFFMFLWLFFSWIIYLYGVKICYLLNKRALKQ